MPQIIIVSYNSDAYQQVLSLRNKILRKPLQLELTETDTATDADEIIIGMFDDTGQIMACVQLRPLNESTLKLRQMAVDEKFQKQGLGKELVAFAEQTAIKSNYRIIKLHARRSVLNFYLKSGYRKTSDEFIEVGIPHFAMEKVLI